MCVSEFSSGEYLNDVSCVELYFLVGERVLLSGYLKEVRCAELLFS